MCALSSRGHARVDRTEVAIVTVLRVGGLQAFPVDAGRHAAARVSTALSATPAASIVATGLANAVRLADAVAPHASVLWTGASAAYAPAPVVPTLPPVARSERAGAGVAHFAATATPARPAAPVAAAHLALALGRAARGLRRPRAHQPRRAQRVALARVAGLGFLGAVQYLALGRHQRQVAALALVAVGVGRTDVVGQAGGWNLHIDGRGLGLRVGDRVLAHRLGLHVERDGVTGIGGRPWPLRRGSPAAGRQPDRQRQRVQAGGEPWPDRPHVSLSVVVDRNGSREQPAGPERTEGSTASRETLLSPGAALRDTGRAMTTSYILE